MYHIGMTSAEQLVALINDTNGLDLTLEDVSFGIPSVITAADQPGEPDPANTKIAVIAKPNRYPLEATEVTYDRINLAAFVTLAPPEGIVVAVPITLENVLSAFNAHYYSNLTLEDLDPSIELPAEFVEGEPIEFKAASGSIAYRGSLILLAEPSVRKLSDLITNTDLPGLQIGNVLKLYFTVVDLPGLVIA